MNATEKALDEARKWEHLALRYAESIGVYEYDVNDHLMEFDKSPIPA